MDSIYRPVPTEIWLSPPGDTSNGMEHVSNGSAYVYGVRKRRQMLYKETMGLYALWFSPLSAPEAAKEQPDKSRYT